MPEASIITWVWIRFFEVSIKWKNMRDGTFTKRACWSTDLQIDRHTDGSKKRHRKTDRQTYGQIHEETERKTKRQKFRQTEVKVSVVGNDHISRWKRNNEILRDHFSWLLRLKFINSCFYIFTIIKVNAKLMGVLFVNKNIRAWN